MLILEQQHGPAWRALAGQGWAQANLLNLEEDQLQHDHIDAGERLLKNWGLDQFCVDALRYQARPVAEVLDAAPLVRICWLANALVEARLQPPAALCASGCELLGLAAGSLDDLAAELQAAILAECRALDQAVLVPENLSPQGLQELQTAVHQQTELLRRQFEIEFMLAQYGGLDSSSPDGLRALLGRVLPDVGIAPVYMLLQSGTDPDLLGVVASANTRTDPEGLTLVCTAGRSALADGIAGQDISALLRETARSVVDHQVLDLLGGQYVLCEVVRDGSRRVALLLGLSAEASSRYMALGGLRQFLRGALQQMLQEEASDHSVAMLLYRQRVREAVHEASNPLTIIKNYLQIIGIKQGDLAQSGEELRLIKTEIDRVAHILAGLREPERSHRHHEALNLNTVIGNMHRMFASAFSSERDIRVTLNLAPEPAVVMGNENALKQVLTNLVKNSAEAIDSDGVIAISTRTNVYLHGRFHVQLCVEDNGSGMTPALMRKLFIQGTTTKGGPHHGSGLTIVKRLVEDMHGQISCQSDSKGTAITILLPQVT